MHDKFPCIHCAMPMHPFLTMNKVLTTINQLLGSRRADSQYCCADSKNGPRIHGSQILQEIEGGLHDYPVLQKLQETFLHQRTSRHIQRCKERASLWQTLAVAKGELCCQIGGTFAQDDVR